MNNHSFGLSNQNLMDILEKYALTTGGLAIASVTSKVQTATDVYYFLSGKLYKLAATDNLIVLSGTINNSGATLDMINVFVFSVDFAGTVTATMGTEAAALENVVFPATPAGEAVIGFIIVDMATNAGTGDFVGGTTLLTGGTPNPAVTYFDTIAPIRFD